MVPKRNMVSVWLIQQSKKVSDHVATAYFKLIVLGKQN